MRSLPIIAGAVGAVALSGALAVLEPPALRLGELPLGGRFLLLLSFLGLWTTAAYQFKAEPSSSPLWTGQNFRLLIYAVLAASVVTSLASGLDLFADDRSALRLLFVNASLVLGLIILRCRDDSRGRLFKFGDILLLNVILTVCLLEACLLMGSRLFPSRLLYDPTDADSMISVFRLQPHSVGYGFTYSSLGYHDDEFFAAGDQDLVIALLADSFGVGIVPYRYNFATVAERELKIQLAPSYRRIAIHNFGIPSIGMREYFHVLNDEALNYDPSQVVLCVYVGNDIEGLTRLSRRDRYLIQDWLFARYIKRFLAIYANMRDEGRGVGDIYDYLRMKSLGHAVPEESAQREGAKTKGTEKEAEAELLVPDYIHDWTKEKPHLSATAFKRWERSRLYIADRTSRATQERYAGFFAALDAFHEILGQRLLVLIIPDQFQLEDDLWQQLMATTGRPQDFERDYPQQQISARCRIQGINYIDLLPELRTAQAQGRTYHLRDTHWNARGNRIAGKALARWLVERNSVTGSQAFE